MTEAYFNDSCPYYEIEVKGHAGFNAGNDIVCAGCSLTVYTMLNCIKEMEEDDDLRILAETDEDGYYYIQVYTENDDRIQPILHMAATAFSLMEQQYPEHVKLIM